MDMSQKEEILSHLKEQGEITAIEALRKMGCFRLSARIKDLRNEGHDIETTMISRNGKRFAKYELSSE